jgi:hypothetical protein
MQHDHRTANWSVGTLPIQRDHEKMRPLQILSYGDKILKKKKNKQTNTMSLSPRANYTDWETATCRRNLVAAFVDRGMLRGHRDGPPTVVNLSFLDRSR